MTKDRTPRLAAALLLAGAVAAAVAGPAMATRTFEPSPRAVGTTAPEPWDGAVDLYRDGAFTTQHTWLWCTAAGVQIVRNLVEGDDDHSRSGQERYFDWMRQRNRYDLPESAGVDPQGWAAGLRAFVDDRYRLVASRTFDGAVRSAARNLRLTDLPVAVTVANGGHGWILTGFSATADPAVTDDFQVTSVRVVGPLYGRQSRNGYDMAPNTRLSIERFRGFFTPWRYEPLPMTWDGRFVSIQPVVEAVAVPAPTPATVVRDVVVPGPRPALVPGSLATFRRAGPSVR